MFFAVLTKSSYLREVVSNFELNKEGLKHFGLQQIPKRSSISDANRNRDSSIFGYFYQLLYQHYKSILSDSYIFLAIQGEIAPNRVEIFDSTTIRLFKDIFKTTGRIPINGRRKGGIKAFSKITLSECVPNFICLKSAATNEKVFLKKLQLAKGTIAVFDKGFQKFDQYQEWSDQEIFFVTQANKNIRFRTLEILPIENNYEDGIHRDSIIELSYKKGKKYCSTIVRLVNYIDPLTGKEYSFISNLMDVKAQTICDLYKNRWVIEPLFKQIKQNFELKYFLSESEEGIKTQIWIAMILNLLFAVLHKKIKEAISFSTLVKLAAKNCSSYVSFIDFIRRATVKKQKVEIIQLALFDNQGNVILNNST